MDEVAPNTRDASGVVGSFRAAREYSIDYVKACFVESTHGKLHPPQPQINKGDAQGGEGEEGDEREDEGEEAEVGLVNGVSGRVVRVVWG